MVTKICLGCTKLKSHKYRRPNEDELWPLCSIQDDTFEHIMLNCECKKYPLKINFKMYIPTLKS